MSAARRHARQIQAPQAAAGPSQVGPEAFETTMSFVIAGLNALPGVSALPGAGTFYAFANVEGAIRALGLADDDAFTDLLLTRAGVAVVAGSGFGAPGHIRISFATSHAQLETALRRMGELLKR